MQDQINSSNSVHDSNKEISPVKIDISTGSSGKNVRPNEFFKFLTGSGNPLPLSLCLFRDFAREQIERTRMEFYYRRLRGLTDPRQIWKDFSHLEVVTSPLFLLVLRIILCLTS